jgi:hypothetical protein
LESVQDKGSEEVRAAAAATVAALAAAGGPHLWTGSGAGWEEALKLAIPGLEDASQVGVAGVWLNE